VYIAYSCFGFTALIENPLAAAAAADDTNKLARSFVDGNRVVALATATFAYCYTAMASDYAKYVTVTFIEE
jgi:hypothetical protein